MPCLAFKICNLLVYPSCSTFDYFDPFTYELVGSVYVLSLMGQTGNIQNIRRNRSNELEVAQK